MKKVLHFLLVAVLLAMTGIANAQTVIHSASLEGFVPPAWDHHPDYDVTVPENAHYSIANVDWFAVLDPAIGDAALSPEDVFHTVYAIYIDVLLLADEGYVFADDMGVTFNGDPSILDTEYSGSNDGGATYHAYSINYYLEDPGYSPAILSVDLEGFVPPVWGEHPNFDLTVPTGVHYSISDIYWIAEDESGANVDILQPNDVFNTEGAIYIQVKLHADEGYFFDDFLEVSFNGDASILDIVASGILDHGTTLVVYSINYYLEAPGLAAVIDTARLEGFVPPVWGQHPNYELRVPANVHYSITDISWVAETDSEDGFVVLSADDVFNTEEAIYIELQLQADAGYAFSDNLKVYFNGDPSIYDAEYSGSDNEGTTYTIYSINYNLKKPDFGTEENTAERLSLWPNPADNAIFMDNVEGTMVRVYDLTGRLVKEECYQGRLDISNLEPGVYTVRANGFMTKFVKE